MESRTRVPVTGGIGVVAAAAMLASTVSPFDYGVVEGAVVHASRPQCRYQLRTSSPIVSPGTVDSRRLTGHPMLPNYRVNSVLFV